MTPISAPISMNSSPCRERDQPALAEREAAQQDQRDRRDPHPRREPAEQPDPENERADLDEDERAVVHLGQPASGDDADEVVEAVAGADRDDRVAAAQRGRPGPGAGSTSVSRTIATIEHRVRVRAFVSPSGRPTNGESARSGICSIDRPATCSRRPASWVRISEPPSTSDSAVASSSRQLDGLAGAVGVVLVGEREFAAAVAEIEDRQPTSLVGHDVMAHTDSGQFGALDVGGHASIMAPDAAASRDMRLLGRPPPL